MSTTTLCECSCGARLRVPRERLGQWATCPKCARKLRLVPADPDEPLPATLVEPASAPPLPAVAPPPAASSPFAPGHQPQPPPQVVREPASAGTIAVGVAGGIGVAWVVLTVMGIVFSVLSFLCCGGAAAIGAAP